MKFKSFNPDVVHPAAVVMTNGSSSYVLLTLNGIPVLEVGDQGITRYVLTESEQEALPGIQMNDAGEIATESEREVDE